MKTAREATHSIIDRMDRGCDFGPADQPGGHHDAKCDALTAAIEARDRQVIEACAVAVTEAIKRQRLEWPADVEYGRACIDAEAAALFDLRSLIPGGGA